LPGKSAALGAEVALFSCARACCPGAIAATKTSAAIKGAATQTIP
jgi:hypothetical protein